MLIDRIHRLLYILQYDVNCFTTPYTLIKRCEHLGGRSVSFRIESVVVSICMLFTCSIKICYFLRGSQEFWHGISVSVL